MWGGGGGVSGPSSPGAVGGAVLSYFGKEFPHKVWVTNASSDDRGYRYATVKKTVAYVVIDEDDNGEPVIEKWNIKGHRIYENKSK